MESPMAAGLPQCGNYQHAAHAEEVAQDTLFDLPAAPADVALPFNVEFT
jgi:hypothetical protein